MQSTWILAAGKAEAVIYTSRGGKNGLAEHRRFEHPEGRMHDRELTSDLPGRAYDSSGQGRHAMEQAVDPKTHSAIGFAKELAEQLHRACDAGECRKLYIAAPPAFLGLLREKYSKPVQDALALELNNNLVGLNADEVRGHLPEYI